MLSFQQVTLDNVRTLTPYLENQPYQTCDYTMANIFQWRAFFSTAFAVTHGMLVLLATYPGEGQCYAYPSGDGDMQSAISEIEADARERGCPLTFCAAPEAGMELLKARYGVRAEISTHRDWADYLYLAENLKTFPGKAYHGQKNHLNRFIKENPNYRYVPITAETLPAAVEFLANYEKHTPVDKAIEAEEMLRSQELLKHAVELELPAGYIETDGTIVALSIGEIVQDTLYVHVEKARLDYPGAYQAIVSEFAKAACRPDTLYINREDDSGEEGLRRSKLAYQPIRLVDKYWVTIRK